MEKKIIGSILLIIISLNLYSQELNYFYVDSASYSMYLNSDWKGLIKLGKKSMRNGIDFYYLKLRLGQAYFEQAKYLKAIPYFEDAYKINPDYEFTQKYLYYSYLYSGMKNQSLRVYSDFSPNVKHNIKILNKKIKGFDISFSIAPNLTFVKNQNENYLTDFNLIAYTYLERNTTSFKLGLDYQLSKKIFLYQNFELTKDSYNIIKQSATFEGFDINLSTFQMRINSVFSYNFGNRWVANFNYNIIFGKIEDISEDYLLSATPSRWIYSYNFGYFQLSSGASISKQFSIFELKSHVNFFKTYEQNYLYAGADFLVMPLSNSNLYLKSSINYSLFEQNIQPKLISTELGFRLFKISFYGTYYMGSINNFVECDGAYVYNSPETISSFFGGGFSFAGTADNVFYFTFLPMQMEYNYYNYLYNGNQIEYTNTLNKILLKIGIKWNL
ncbi:MAG: tetratricopeptide repeat protein [Bacteroidales bacterium]|nr:tetratricopeptide repeat protein [Bacteroidales bacterium]